MYFYIVCATCNIISSGPKKLIELKFSKKGSRLGDKKISAHSASYCPLWQTPSNYLIGCTIFFGMNGAFCKIVPLTLKTLLKI